MDAGSTPKGMLIYSCRTVLRWSNFRNSFAYFFGSPYLALSMTVLFFLFQPRFHHRIYTLFHIVITIVLNFLR